MDRFAAPSDPSKDWMPMESTFPEQSRIMKRNIRRGKGKRGKEGERLLWRKRERKEGDEKNRQRRRIYLKAGPYGGYA
jgi:hypothetical protein